MPAWPTQSDYKDSLQNPDTAFRDPALRLSQAERSPMGVPRARSGAFASVYKMTGPRGVVALKLFNFPNEDRARRYQAVSDFLERELGSRKPDCLVTFQYHLDGIRSGKGWYPTLTMDWVKGTSLGEWVRQTIERKNPDVAAMRKMAESWGALVEQLQEHKIAHGDLQHDNVMVVGDKPVLVDYDGMCVPALDPADPRKKLEQLEFGKPAYQHPARPEQRLSANLDHFAAWVILIAIRAIATDPQLYVKYNLKTDNENLLFSPLDMSDPERSALWPDLMRCKDLEVAGWARMLRDSLGMPFDKIPPFTLDPFNRLRKLVSTTPRDWPQIEAETERLKKAGKSVPPVLQAAADPISALRELCAARLKDWPAILSEGGRLAASGKALAAELKGVVEEARKRVASRDALQRAADARDPRAMVLVYRPELVDDWVAKPLLSTAKRAAGQVQLLDKLKAATASPGDGKPLITLWDMYGSELAGVAEARAYEAAAASWKNRVRAAAAFAVAFGKSPQSERELAEAWRAVLAAGPLHSSVTKEQRKRGEQAQRWAPLLEPLYRVPKTASFTNDRALVNAWGTGAELAGCTEAIAFTRRVEDAKERLTLIKGLERAIQKADAGASDDVVLVAAAKLPAGYEHPYKTRVQEGAEAVKLLGDLQRCVSQEVPSDRKIAASYDQLCAKNPKLAERLDRVDARLASEVASAVSRRSLLDAFAAIDAHEPRADRADRKWRETWEQHGKQLANRHDREELRQRLTLARDRLMAWAKLAESLTARDMFTLRKRVAESATLLAGYPPLVERSGEIQSLLKKADRVIELQQKLVAGDALLADDLSFLRGNTEAFGAEVRRKIEQQVRERLASEARLVPAYPAYQLTGSRGSLVKACWAWGGHGLISYCVVAVDGRRFLSKPDEADPYSRLTCRAENYQREGGGVTLVPPAGAAQAYVTIWPVVDLGWTTVFGPALTVGPVPVTREGTFTSG